MDENGAKSMRSPPETGGETCVECGACRRACALLEKHGSPAAMWSAPDAEPLAYACTLCGRCEAVCPTGVAVTARFRRIREEAYRSGRGPRRAWAGRRLFERLGCSRPWRAYFTRPGAADLFFPGCNLAGLRPETARRMWEELDAVAPGIGVGLDCCGIIGRDLGDREGHARHVARMGAELSRRGVRRIVSACPSCTRTLRAAALPVEVVSAYELLASAPPGAPDAERGEAVLHESCGSHLDPGFNAAARRLAERSGYTVVRPKGALQGPVCCADVRWEGGPEGPRLLTACAGCYQTIARGAKRPGAVGHLLDDRFGIGAGGPPPGLPGQFAARLKLKRLFRRLFAGTPSREGR